MNDEKLLSMYEFLLSAEMDSLKTVDSAKCLADFEEVSPELYHFILEIGSVRYELYQFLKKRGLK